MTKDNPARALAGEIERLSRDGHYRPDEWMRFLTLDVLAGFGKRLERPWDEYQSERLLTLSRRYAQLVIDHPWQDILGPTYMELGSHGQRNWLGQYFTPQVVAGAMARITLSGLDLNEFPPGRLINVMEPCAGSGVMLLAACEAIVDDFGAAALPRFSFTAIDLDPLCSTMTACQMIANGAMHGAMGELVVYQGNALGPDSDLDVVVHMVAAQGAQEVAPRTEETPAVPEPLRIVEVLPAKAPERIAAIRQAAVAAGQQMSLFGDEELPIPVRKRA